MVATITAFATSPDQGQGMARDMRVRWAFEELGQPYAVRLVTFAEMKQLPLVWRGCHDGGRDVFCRP